MRGGGEGGREGTRREERKREEEGGEEEGGEEEGEEERGEEGGGGGWEEGGDGRGEAGGRASEVRPSKTQYAWDFSMGLSIFKDCPGTVPGSFSGSSAYVFSPFSPLNSPHTILRPPQVEHSFCS